MTKFTFNKKSLLSLISTLLVIIFLVINESAQDTQLIITDSNYIDQIVSSSADISLLDQSETSSSIPSITNNNSHSENATPTNLYTVTKVIDGDTFEVERNGIKEKVRLIGINTPETVDPRKKVECFGKEASAYAKQLLTGQTLRLESDPSQDPKDKYGRLLAYAYFSDNTSLNLQMIAAGYAYEYTYKTPYLNQAEFKAAQAKAKENKLGLWSPSTCAGKK